MCAASAASQSRPSEGGAGNAGGSSRQNLDNAVDTAPDEIARRWRHTLVTCDVSQANHDSPVELQVETMSSTSSRVFLYTWYAVLVAALILQSNVALQWSCRSFCDATEVAAYHLDDWNSSACVSWEAYWVKPEPASLSEKIFMSVAEADQGVRSGVQHDADCLHAHADNRGIGRCRYISWPPLDGIRDDSVLLPDCNVKNVSDHLVRYASVTRVFLPMMEEEAVAAIHASDPRISLPYLRSDAPSARRSSQRAPPPSLSPGPTMPPLQRVYKLRWTTDALGGVLNYKLNRFFHVFIRLASPLAGGPPRPPPVASAPERTPADTRPQSPMQKVYDVRVALQEIPLIPDSDNSLSGSSSSGTSSSGPVRNDTNYVYTYRASVTCREDASRCSSIVLPSSVVIPANGSTLTLTLLDVDAELAEATIRDAVEVGGRCTSNRPHSRSGPPTRRQGGETSTRFNRWGSGRMHRAPFAATLETDSVPSSAVGVMFQRSQYTMGTLVFRYIFLLITLVSTLRFLYRARHLPCLLYEQRWTLVAQLGLLLYLNPFYWWCLHVGTVRPKQASGHAVLPGSVTVGRRLFLYYVEFHLPTYFAALVVCYVWSIIAGSFCWTGAGEDAATVREAHHVTRPPPPTETRSSGHLREAEGASSLSTVRGQGVHAVRFRTRVMLITYLTMVTALDIAQCFFEESGIGVAERTCKSVACLRVQKCINYVLLLGILLSGVGLYWLRRNLSRHPYLSTRPQQLACRIMIFMYFTGGTYCVLQVALLDMLYAPLLGIIYYQPLVQLSHLLVLTSLVNHMTYVYTTTQSSLMIPLRPSDPRWKKVGWSSRWYRWLSWHGGSLYVFFSEAEERFFYEVQVARRLAKRAAKTTNKKKVNGPTSTTNTDQRIITQEDVTDAEVRECGEGYRLHLAVESEEGEGKSRSAFTPPAPSLLHEEREGTVSVFREGSEWFTPQGMSSRRRTLSSLTTTRPSASTSGQCSLTSEDDEGLRGDEIRGESPHPECPQGISEGPEETAPHMFECVATPRAAQGAGAAPFGDDMGVSYIDTLPQPLRAAGSATEAPVEPSSAAPHDNGGPSRQMRSHASSRMLDMLRKTESRLLDGTATFLDVLAEACVDRPLQVLLRQRARRRFVFFNLETAIDCLNLSCEAYAVQESCGDDFIQTGLQVNAAEMPRAALGFAERAALAIFGLFWKPSLTAPSAFIDNAREDEVEGEDRQAGFDLHSTQNERRPLLEARESLGSRRSPAAQVSEETTVQPWALFAAVAALPRGNAAASVQPPPSSNTPPRSSDSQVPSRDFTASPSPASSEPSLLSTRGDAVPSAIAHEEERPPPMNVQRYGYHQIAVLETHGVQVVVARMDTSGACAAHAGKAPRLVIAFRGTDNAANALENIRFRQRIWREMETPALSARATVHSGFLELWMSLKESVMNVVLQELRRQCVPLDEVEDGAQNDEFDVRGGGRAAHSEICMPLHEECPPDHERQGNARSRVAPVPRWKLPCTRGLESPAATSSESREGFLRVYVTGHSLGGALASLCAYTLRRVLLLLHYPEPSIVVYTYGQPRIGNSVFKLHYNQAVPCTFRVVNESDVVSGFNIFGGHHVGVQVNIDRHGNYICKPMYIERLFRPTRGLGSAVANHTVAAYANSLNAMADVYANGVCPLRCGQPYVCAAEATRDPPINEGEAGSCGRERTAA